MRKNVFWFVMIMLLALTSLHSGCGGSSGGDVSLENPSNPNTPTTPNTPSNPDTPTTTYDFSILTGTWTPSNGTGTATGNGVNAIMTLKDGQVALTNATSGGSVTVSANIYWDAVQGGSVLLSDVRDNFGGSGTHTFTHVSGNTWRYINPDPDGAGTTTVTITSSTTATVERDGYYSDDDFSNVHFHMTYTITKQNATQTPTTPETPTTIYDFSTLAGTWTASNANGTISGISGTTKNGAVTLSNAEISFSSIDVSGNTATANMAIKTVWDWSYGTENHTHETNTHPNNAPFQRINGNTWRWSKTDSPYPDETITITLTSATTATVEQGLNPKHNSEVYRLATSFTITKQSTTTAPTTIYDLSTLAGTWIPSNGKATMIGSGENNSLTMRTDSGNYSFSNVQVSGNTATVSVNGETHWTYDVSGRNFGIDYVDEAAKFQRNSGNIWNWTHDYDNDDESRTITITSPTTAEVREELNLGFTNGNTYRWTATYTLTKQSSTTPNTPTTISFTTLTGTWQASDGSGTVTGTVDGRHVSTTMSLTTSQGNKNTITFSNVNVSGSTGTLEAVLDIIMDIAGYDEIWEDEFGGGKAYQTGELTFQNTGGNTWRMDRTSHDGTPRRTIITFTSATTAKVERYDGHAEDSDSDIEINASYTITKQ